MKSEIKSPKIQPWFKGSDISAFWALFADNLANAMILIGVLVYVFKLPGAIVFGRVLPGLGISLMTGLGFYAWQARRLAARENRTDVTALPYGISTPVLFVYLFGVIGPVAVKTGDPIIAWQAGIAAAFVGGVIESLGSVFGPLLKRVTPRAGMLGTLAGIALVWIATVPMAEIFENPVVGFTSLSIIIIGLVAGVRLPFGMPAGLAAISAGTLVALATGVAHVKWTGLTLNLPAPVIGDLVTGLKFIWNNPYILAIVFPIEIYNFIETMNNVESAEAAGDSYDVRTCQIMDGVGTMAGSLFGSPFPTTVYIGHPAYKKLGAGSGYALGVGTVFIVAALTGIFTFIHELIPVAAVAPMLVFVGTVMAGQAFTASPPHHAIAVAFAMIPHVSDILFKKSAGAMGESFRFLQTIAANTGAGIEKLSNIMGELTRLDSNIAGPHASALIHELLQKQGIHLTGQSALSRGAILTGLIWGAITALAIDGKFGKAALFAAVAALLSLVGIIHGQSLGFFPESRIFWGYCIFVAVFAISSRGKGSGVRQKP
ncbi:MAG: xanthine/uracil/vitamin C permease [Candidatus Wallbacteria bacterium HGW-Wallbacteria-1]|jgi:AGZA family xanthine/uracil permease-like MFS transporter|uniref:Xanthine/uracil/vitamin C permease n=1 Tax=Candidatus Wallbacteria bacterium HGW-Wallbacteria-1 TaxID=2013854 RepID=A0A2N1PPC8_9BACT|nr:MAG: xanthine/uracil/vitamin C permease [Candidatus Wallbacteria bacterium HGW-Wallbacteria-1]